MCLSRERNEQRLTIKILVNRPRPGAARQRKGTRRLGDRCEPETRLAGGPQDFLQAAMTRACSSAVYLPVPGVVLVEE